MARGICLICMYEPKDEGECRHIRQSQPHMLHMLCNASATLKICRNLPNAVLPHYITTDAVHDCGIFILTFNLYSQYNVVVLIMGLILV